MPEQGEPGIEHRSDIPECRVLAAAEPAGIIRFEVSREYAEDLLDRVRDARQLATDGLVTIMLPMDYPAYASLTHGFAELHSLHQETGEIAEKQVVVTPDAQDVAVAVLVNASQMESSMKKNYLTIKKYGEKRAYGQQFSVSRNGAVMLIQQLEAFLEGAEDPLDTVDPDDDRFPEVRD